MVEPQVFVIVPCYNEESRLSIEAFSPLIVDKSISVIFVNDGSTDNTEALLKKITSEHPSTQYLSLAQNAGKAEAVRQGMLEAARQRANIIGYLDADASTPAGEALRLIGAIQSNDNIHAVLGARVALLGSDIHRRASRHYLGRLFAMMASTILDLKVYDTQCGAKLFRNTETLRASLAAPFRSRWAFDVELIGRLLIGPQGTPPVQATQFLEVPLHEWSDVAGSKLNLISMVKSGLELIHIAIALDKQRRL